MTNVINKVKAIATNNNEEKEVMSMEEINKKAKQWGNSIATSVKNGRLATVKAVGKGYGVAKAACAHAVKEDTDAFNQGVAEGEALFNAWINK